MRQKNRSKACVMDHPLAFPQVLMLSFEQICADILIDADKGSNVAAEFCRISPHIFKQEHPYVLKAKKVSVYLRQIKEFKRRQVVIFVSPQPFFHIVEFFGFAAMNVKGLSKVELMAYRNDDSAVPEY